MDFFDFPLILTWAVIITGFIWAVDYFALLPRRRSTAQALPDGTTPEARDAVLQESIVVEYARSFFPVFALVYVLRGFLVEPYQIPSESMVPTLQIGDFILVNKFTYGIRVPVLNRKVIQVNDPQRGDVMVFVPPRDSRYFIKRVIGVPGDYVRFINKQLTINGTLQPRTFVAQFPPEAPEVRWFNEQLGSVQHVVQLSVLKASREGAIDVPKASYFMMGDNRDNSADSRFWGLNSDDYTHWGFAADDHIVGRAFAIWVHKDPGWSWPTFARNRIIR